MFDILDLIQVEIKDNDLAYDALGQGQEKESTMSNWAIPVTDELHVPSQDFVQVSRSESCILCKSDACREAKT